MNEEEILKIMEELKENVRYKTIIPNEKRNEWKRQFDAIQGLLDLYYKQQKEIEELKHDNSILCEIAYKRIQLPYTMVYTGTDNFISKNKIKELIKELENYNFKGNFDDVDFIQSIIQQFKELLGE